MAITPQEAARKAKPSKEMLKNLEEKIDKILVEAQERGTSATVDASIFGNTATRTAVMDSYRKAGWNVKYSSDQRDGDYLSFSPKPARNHSTSQYD